MTLTDALERVDQQFDLIAAQNLLDAEVFIQDLGGSDVEVAAFVARRRDELTAVRRRMRDMVRASWWTGLDSVSSRLH